MNDELDKGDESNARARTLLVGVVVRTRMLASKTRPQSSQLITTLCSREMRKSITKSIENWLWNWLWNRLWNRLQNRLENRLPCWKIAYHVSSWEGIILSHLVFHSSIPQQTHLQSSQLITMLCSRETQKSITKSIDYEIDWKIDYEIDWVIAYRVEKSPIVLAAEKE